MTGTFTDQAWLIDPPARCDLTVAQLADLLRLAILGEPLPYRYSYTGPLDVLADLYLVATNENRQVRESLAMVERESAASRRAYGQLWRLVWDNSKRKTLRTKAVRAILDGAQS